MSDFIEAIKQGIEASSNYDRNMKGILNVFEDVNKAVLEKTGKDNAVFIIKDKSISSGYFNMIRFGNHAYPVEIRLHGNIYNCHDEIALVDTLHDCLSSASFGFYVKGIMESQVDLERIRKNIPEGATHHDSSGCYWMVNGDIAHFNRNGRWVKYFFSDVQRQIEKGTIIPLS